MKKKLQVFISSTYIDMKEERQAAVTAVLNAGHIPAGMELFKSGDQSQKETIKRWIDESDVYMLILGSRYGSIDTESGKSYTHWEYDYAGEQGKRRFAIVIKDEMEKAKTNPEYLEREHFTEYQDFKKEVLSNISKFYEDLKDIRLIVMESLKEYEDNQSLIGWIRADNLNNHTKIIEENNILVKDNGKLKEELEKEKRRIKTSELIDGHSFVDVRDALSGITLQLRNEYGSLMARTLLRTFIDCSTSFNVGISNLSTSSKLELSLTREAAPLLLTFGLVEKVKTSSYQQQKYQTSREGLKFQALYRIEVQKTK